MLATNNDWTLKWSMCFLSKYPLQRNLPPQLFVLYRHYLVGHQHTSTWTTAALTTALGSQYYERPFVFTLQWYVSAGVCFACCLSLCTRPWKSTESLAKLKERPWWIFWNGVGSFMKGNRIFFAYLYCKSYLAVTSWLCLLCFGYPSAV